MTKVFLECAIGSAVTTLVFESSLLGAWKWHCIEGASVWGGLGNGTAPSKLFQNQGPDILQISTTDYIYGTRGMKKGLSGQGERMDDGGGSFPAGDFDWTCIKYE